MPRSVLASVVLVAEYLLLSVWVDALSVEQRGGIWVAVSHVGAIAPLGVVILTAALLVGAGRKATLARVAGERIRPALVGLHVGLFAGFAWLTVLLFSKGAPPQGPPLLWLGAWFAFALGSAFTLFSALFGGAVFAARRLGTTVVFCCAVGVLGWVAGNLSMGLWRRVSRVTLGASEALLRAVFDHAIADPDQLVLGLDDFEVEIAPICSGLEGVGLISVLVFAFLWVFRSELRFPRAFFLWPIGVAVVWFGNVVRISALVALGARVHGDFAFAAFHSKGGWVLFCAVALGLFALGRRSRTFCRNPDVVGHHEDNPTAAYLMPLLVLIACMLVIGAFASPFALVHELRTVAAVMALVAYRRHFEIERARISLESVGIGIAVGIAWVATQDRSHLASDVDVAAMHARSAWTLGAFLVARIVASVVVVPLCEELAFRGYVLRRLISRDFTSVSFGLATPAAVIGSALVFGALHSRWVMASLAGAAFAFAQIRGGRLWDAVVAHGTSNAIIVAVALVTGDLGFWL